MPDRPTLDFKMMSNVEEGNDRQEGKYEGKRRDKAQGQAHLGGIARTTQSNAARTQCYAREAGMVL
jgi:hypothetical protein